MNLFKTALILLLWIVVGVAVSFVAYLLTPKQYVSIAEIALDPEGLSSEGLARFEPRVPERSADLEILAQLLKSARVGSHAAEKIGGLSPGDVKRGTKVLTQRDSVIITLRTTGKSPDQARAMGGTIIDKAMALDAEKKTVRTRDAIAAVEGQLTATQKQLEQLNGRIQQTNTERGITLSSDEKRQQGAVLELSQYEQKLAALRVEESALKNRGARIDALLASGTAKDGPEGYEIEDLDRDPSLAAARRKLLDQESALASLRSRYGAQHASVRAAAAEAASTRTTLRDMLATQRQQLASQLGDNASAQKIVTEKIAATEGKARQSDLTLDPAYADLLAQRDALRTSYTRLLDRLAELRVYADARPTSFYLFSEPSLPDKASRAQLASIVAIGAVLGALAGFAHSLLRFRPSREPLRKTSPEPVYAP